MTDPEMLLFDEPSAGLEPRLGKRLYESLERLRYDENRGILLVDQNVRQAMQIADYVYILEMGRNKVEGIREDFDKDLNEIIKEWF
jgi:branched-chain amino acid transport system ATP-binding protein